MLFFADLSFSSSPDCKPVSFQTRLIVDVFDADVNGLPDSIDNFTIAIPRSVTNCNQSNSLTFNGTRGIGKLTLGFFNLITNPMGCKMEDDITVTLNSQATGGNLCNYS